MAVGFASYEVARSGLFVSERGLYTTGHNISNVNTPGYVRQQAMITMGPYQNSFDRNGLCQIGLGADIQQIRQIRHTFLDNIYRQENTSLGYWETRDKAFRDVEAILGEPMESGLQDIMNQFWDSWQELSKDPNSLTVRSLVRQRGEAFVNYVNHLGAQTEKLQSDLNSEIKVKIDEINNISTRIAKLNSEIAKAESSGDMANDFRDQRNALLDRLTRLVDVDAVEMQNNQVDVTIDGYYIVQRDRSSALYADDSGRLGLFCVPKLKDDDLEVKFKGGIVQGLIEARGEVFGAKGSLENGTPNTKADIVFAVDVSDTGTAYLDKIRDNINSYVNELMKSGIDYNLRLVTFDGTGVISDSNYANDVNSFIVGVRSLSLSGDSGNDFGSVATLLGTTTDFRQDANRYALVFTGESIGGDGNVLLDATVQTYVNQLAGNKVKTSVITGSSFFEQGEVAAEKGWNAVTSGTGGNLYDINAAASDYETLMTTVNSDVNGDVNKGISLIPQSSNILSDLRKRLNALINIMVREVNYLQRSGKTLGTIPEDGEDFFTAIDSSRPLEMGNIKLNDNFAQLTGLNKIVASESGASGDNTIALKIANLRNVPALRELTGVLSIDEYYQSIILSVGNGGSEAATVTENQNKLVQSADSSRQSIMGVSMDEEMTNMMKFKFAYDASARTLNMIDSMMETIILRMGLVGR